MVALFVKKLLYYWRNPLLIVTQILLPFLIVNMILLIIHSAPNKETTRSVSMTLDSFKQPLVKFFFDDSASNFAGKYEETLRRGNVAKIQGINDSTAVNHDITSVSNQEYNYEFMISAIVASNSSDPSRIRLTSLFNNQAFHTPAISMRYLDEAMIRYKYNVPDNFSLHVQNNPMPLTTGEKNKASVTNSQSTLQILQALLLGLSFLVGSFVLLTVKENNTKGKHLQKLCSVKMSLYWLTYFVIDFIMFMAISLLFVLIFQIYKQEYLHEESQPFYIMLVMLFTSFSLMPFAYCLSFMFELPATAHAKLCLIMIVTGMATNIFDQITSIEALGLLNLNEALNPVFSLFLPLFNMVKAITNLMTNFSNYQTCNQSIGNFSVQKACKIPDYAHIVEPCCKNICKTNCLKFEENTLSITFPGIGLQLIYAVLCALFYWTLLLLIELNYIKMFSEFVQRHKNALKAKFACMKSRDESSEDLESVDDLPEDEDVVAEAKRVQSLVPLKNGPQSMIVKNLVKQYGEFTAVNNISYSVERGQCFGLLGINGAGKTTTFKMITGMESVTKGDIFVNGMSVRREIGKIQQEIGYCPQFDATLDDLTGRETLRFYARLRGVREELIDEEIKELGRLLYFDMHLDKLTGKYSGGNKRKLSTAIALLGNPSISFLDEPTTGVDPVARRCLWEAIGTKLKEGCSVVLTSHSMEECEALCNQLIIMVNGQICCIGTPLHLKNKFGNGYTVLIKVCPGEISARTLSHTSSIISTDSNDPRAPITRDRSQSVKRYGTEQTLKRNLDEVKKFISSRFPSSQLKATHNNLLHYTIESTDQVAVRCSQIFGQLEENRTILRIEDYSVCQTNLEQIFLTFARKQRGSDE